MSETRDLKLKSFKVYVSNKNKRNSETIYLKFNLLDMLVLFNTYGGYSWWAKCL